MILDPFYNQIIEQLSKKGLNPETFEECVADILRIDFPTLVPIFGGSDSGMDGAIADGKSLPFPLITTVSPNVIGNLTRNLKAYIRDGGTRRKVIIATSQELNQRKRRNLDSRAEELGFQLIQTFDRHALANRLYHNQRWCKELLGLTGEPPAISQLPVTSRPLIDLLLIGRDKDLKWLGSTDNDQLLIGQPGSGKTFLLHVFAKENKGYFVINRNCSALASEIRAKMPNFLIVDDAHQYPEFLQELRQLRDEIRASFKIVASSWPGGKNNVAEALNLSNSNIYDLNLLNRDEIVKVVKAVGIHGPRELVKEIVDQSLGKPGLAVTLSHICIQGDVQTVALGDALKRSVVSTFEPMVGKKASVVLAAFAMAGDTGMPMSIVAKAVSLNIVEIRSIVTELAYGGVISEIAWQNSLSVIPRSLRFTLIRDIFYAGPSSLDPTYLIENTLKLSDTVMTLIGAKARGAIISMQDIIDLLEKANSDDAWHAFAWSGRNEANYVIKNYPKQLITVARAALNRTPQSVIPKLLERAIDDDRMLSSTTEHPLRLISDWIKNGYPGTGEVVNRREILLDAIIANLSINKNIETSLKALPYVFCLQFDIYQTDPGIGRTMTFSHGAVTLDELNNIVKLWERIFPVVCKMKNLNWAYIFEIIEEFSFPGRILGNKPNDFYKSSKKAAIQILKDVVTIKSIGIGHLRRIKYYSKQLKTKLNISIDSEFEVLYPIELLDDKIAWETTKKREEAAVRKLADKMPLKDIESVVLKISSFEKEAHTANITYPRWTPFLCRIIAHKVSKRMPWIKLMMKEKVAVDLIEPFLYQAFTNREDGWETISLTLLDSTSLKRSIIQIILSMEAPPLHILERVLLHLRGFEKTVEMLCAWGNVPEDTLKKLLEHEEPTISACAAIGEYQAESRKTDSGPLKEVWEKAILRIFFDEYWLGVILSKNEELAYRWLKAHINEDPIDYGLSKIYCIVVESLSMEKRRNILKQIPNGYYWANIATALIGDSLELYKEFLEDKNRSTFHLEPLYGLKEDSIDENKWDRDFWISKATLALDAGYSPEKIADSVFGHGWTWTGKTSTMWGRWVERFNSIAINGDVRVQKVGEIGKKMAEERYLKALEEEKREEIYGLD